MAVAGSKIKPIITDGFGDGWRHQEVDGLAGLDPGADLGGGEAQREAVEGATAEGSGKFGVREAGPGDGEEFNEAGEFGGVAPGTERGDVVGANEPVELGAGKAAGVIADGVDGVGDAAAANFLVVDFAAGLAGEGEAEASPAL